MRRPRTSSVAWRHAEARRRARLELARRARIRYEERRCQFEDRPHLSRDTVHLRRPSAVARGESDAVPRTAVLTDSPADIRPFTQTVSLYHRRMPRPLRGSLQLLERQDERLDADGLKSIQTEADLSAIIARKELVPIPVSSGLTVNDHLLVSHRFCRPWTARFLEDLARAHEALFHQPLDVTSAVRPATYQEHLERINGNAAPADGAIVSPHMMGATIDISKHGLSWREIAWMRVNLLALEEAGVIDVEEEFHQACFHITVYPNYVPEPKPAPAAAVHASAAPAAASDSGSPDAVAPADATPASAMDPTPKKENNTTTLPQNNSTGS